MINIEDLKTVAYDSNLGELGVFSKQYFYSVLYNYFKYMRKYCFTFMDFDKLGVINKQYSEETGNLALYNSLKLVKESLPMDTIITRIAGDEFVCITPGKKKQELDKLFIEINKKLEAYLKEQPATTVTASSMDTSIYEDFNDLFSHTELDVTKKKKISKKKSYSTVEELLDATIKRNLSNYFAYYRLDGANRLPKEYYYIIRDSIINIVIHKFEKSNEEILLQAERLRSTILGEAFNDSYINMPYNIANNIHNGLLKEDIDKIDMNDDFEKVFRFLTTDPLTKQCSLLFFNEFIVPKIEQKPIKNMSATVFDLAHLKLSNDILSHNITDEKIKELFSKLISKIKTMLENSNYVLASGSGRLILLEEGHSNIGDKEMEEVLKYAKTNQTILDLVVSTEQCKSNNIGETIKKIIEECQEKKEQLKINKINAKETVIPLRVALNESLDLYINKFDDPYSMQSKQKFINHVFKCLFEVIGNQFPGQPITTDYGEKSR